jgi:hypothetical protein
MTNNQREYTNQKCSAMQIDILKQKKKKAEQSVILFGSNNENIYKAINWITMGKWSRFPKSQPTMINIEESMQEQS